MRRLKAIIEAHLAIGDQSNTSRDNDGAEASGVTVVVRLLSLLKRVLLDHALNAGLVCELDGIDAVGSRARGPAADRGALQEQRNWRVAK